MFIPIINCSFFGVDYYFYTIGQRKGLGIPYKFPIYVTKINKKKNTIQVVPVSETYSKKLIADNVNWLLADRKKTIKVKAMIRYRHKSAEGIVTQINSRKIKVSFSRPQRSVAPGQSIVLYKGRRVLGGGRIKEVLSD